MGVGRWYRVGWGRWVVQGGGGLMALLFMVGVVVSVDMQPCMDALVNLISLIRLTSSIPTALQL